MYVMMVKEQLSVGTQICFSDVLNKMKLNVDKGHSLTRTFRNFQEIACDNPPREVCYCTCTPRRIHGAHSPEEALLEDRKAASFPD